LSFEDNAVGNPFVQRPPDGLAEKLARLGASKSSYSQLREAREHISGIRRPRREKKRHPVRSESARDECEHPCRGLIEPLRVVHYAKQRLVGTDVRQQRQDGETKEEEVWGDPGTQAERRLYRVPLWGRQQVQPIEEWRAQLMQSGERELHLRLDSSRPCYANIYRSCGDVLQERRLADTGLTAENENAALAAPKRIEEPVEGGALRNSSA
jgi:hypothetical protein